MAIYRGRNQHRPVHPKIFIWSHTEKAEIEYFQDFKNHLKTPLLVAKKKKFWTPQELLDYVVKWKKEKISENDNDQVWCVFDVDSFYKDGDRELLVAVENAIENNVKIAYVNECFEHWILFHFEKISTKIGRGKKIEEKINKVFKKNHLGLFKKNQKVFCLLLPFQKKAIKNSESLSPKSYDKINWSNALSEKGNPSASIHFLVKEIIRLFGV